VAVKERPSIESFTIESNKDIKTEDLTKSLRDVGLSAGKTFNQSTLDEIKGFLTDQYYARGKYGVIDAKVEELGRPVKVRWILKASARIRQINVVGNHAFDEDEFARFNPTPH
jgi:outer membrane protein insertion porin family